MWQCGFTFSPKDTTKGGELGHWTTRATVAACNHILSVAAGGPVTVPPVDDVAWLLGQGDVTSPNG